MSKEKINPEKVKKVLTFIGKLALYIASILAVGSASVDASNLVNSSLPVIGGGIVSTLMHF